MKKLALIFLLPGVLFALPQSGKVVSGTAEVQSSFGTMEIKTSDRAILSWEEFSVAHGEVARFVQPQSSSAVLNRIASGVTEIDGLLESNGKVFLYNPRGVVIGKEGVVDTAGFLASTLDLKNGAFLQGKELRFHGAGEGKILNMGRIQALGGDVFLFAKAVVNEGTLRAEGGMVGIAAAEEVLLKPVGEERLFIAPQTAGLEAELAAESTNVYRFAINQSGVIEATGTREIDGRIFLVADQGVNISSGKMVAEGGHVEMRGDQVGLIEGAAIDVSGDFGGGSVLISSEGEGNLVSAALEGSVIYADARVQGNGGEVILWSDDGAGLQGKVYARGGPQGGDGGFVEVSGMNRVTCTGFVNTLAPMGETGDLLIDPTDFNIASMADSGFIFNATTGVYQGTASTADLLNTSLETTLNAQMTNVTVQTSSPFAAFGTITVSEDVSYTSDFDLTLSAQSNVELTGGKITNAGAGGITIRSGGNILSSTMFEGISMTGGGFISLAADGDITIIPEFPSSPTTFESDGAIHFEAGRDVILGSAAGSVRGMELRSDAAVNVTAGRDFLLTGGNASDRYVVIDIGGGTNTFNVGGDLILRGGADSFTSVNIGGTDRIGDMEFSVGGSALLVGGLGSQSYAQIGMNGGTANLGQGDITFHYIEGNLTLQAGSASNSFAQIGHAPINGTGPFFGRGDVSVRHVEGDILLESSAPEYGAFIGHGNLDNSLNLATYEGSVTVEARGDINIFAAETSPSGIGLGFNAGGALERVFVRAHSITLNAADAGDAYIGYYQSDPSVVADVRVERTIVEVRDHLTFNPATEDDTFDGSAAIGVFSADVSNTILGSVEVLAGTIVLNGSSGANGGLSMIVSQENSVSILADNILAGQSGSNASSAVIFGAEEILSLSNKDTFLGPNAIVGQIPTLAPISQSVTLVVDGSHPDEPDIGDNRFVLSAGAALSSAGPVRIFTARRSQNQINAPINGAGFTPGPFLIDSDTEQWGTYFSSSFGGFPFTIFYKTGLPSDIYNLYGATLAEMLLNLKVYDELLYDAKCFLLEYDRECYFQHIHPKGMRSSFDLLPDESSEVLRRKWRNYHTKYVESF